MEEAFGWLQWLDPDDAKLVRLKAEGVRWKLITWRFGALMAASGEAARSMAMGFSINFVLSLNSMLGHNVLANFVRDYAAAVSPTPNS